MSHRVVSKTKSDASTCTRDEIDLDLSDISPQSETPSLSVPKNMSTTFVTTVEIENTHKRMIANQNLDEADKDNNNHMHLVPDSLTFELTKLGGDGGIENAAYQVDDGDEQLELELESKFEESSANVETPPSKEPKGEVSPNSPISSSPATSGATSEDDGNMSDVSTTIIDGKRAISLSNFGKFAAAQQKKDGIQGRMVGPTFGYQMASAGLRPKATAFPK